MGRPIMPSATMLQSESRFTDKEPAPLDQGGQSRAAQHLAVLAQPLLEAQRVDLPMHLLVVLPDQIRVEVHVAVISSSPPSLLFLARALRTQLWLAPARGTS